jgi:heme exporter protein A
LHLIASHLTCQRSHRTLFETVDFCLEPGEALVVTGRNGAGKSSLLAMIAGRLRPASGTLRAEPRLEIPLSEMLHSIGHRDALKSSLSAGENLQFAQDVLGKPALSPEDALKRVGLEAVLDVPVGILSAGQRRRVALARLLVAHRPLWLLDEPTSHLDEAASRNIMSIVEEHQKNGGLVIIATHHSLPLNRVKYLALERPKRHAELHAW